MRITLAFINAALAGYWVVLGLAVAFGGVELPMSAVSFLIAALAGHAAINTYSLVRGQ
jgi:hypothetical protein